VTEFVFLKQIAVVAFHDEQLAEHGGGSGIRDLGLLESALARPKMKAAYGEIDIAVLAASYAFGIAKNHPFVDGNKRTAFVASQVFLRRNGWNLSVGQAEAAIVFRDLAAGELTEEMLTAWFRLHLVALPAK
jgi:death on curing protein